MHWCLMTSARPLESGGLPMLHLTSCSHVVPLFSVRCCRTRRCGSGTTSSARTGWRRGRRTTPRTSSPCSSGGDGGSRGPGRGRTSGIRSRCVGLSFSCFEGRGGAWVGVCGVRGVGGGSLVVMGCVVPLMGGGARGLMRGTTRTTTVSFYCLVRMCGIHRGRVSRSVICAWCDVGLHSPPTQLSYIIYILTW